MGAYLRAKLLDSSKILTSFRQGVFYSLSSKRTPKKPTQIKINIPRNQINILELFIEPFSTGIYRS